LKSPANLPRRPTNQIMISEKEDMNSSITWPGVEGGQRHEFAIPLDQRIPCLEFNADIRDQDLRVHKIANWGEYDRSMYRRIDDTSKLNT
jgi:hypothetical protein